MKQLYKALMTLLIVMSCAISVNAQQNEDKNPRAMFSPALFRQRMEAYITKQAGLSPAEAKNFYPLLHEMLDKQRENGNKARMALDKCNPGSTEDQYEDALMASVGFDQNNAIIEKEYLKKFHKVLSWKQIFLVKQALRSFHMNMLREFSPDGGNNNNRRNWGNRSWQRRPSPQVNE